MPILAEEIEGFNDSVDEAVRDVLSNCEFDLSIDKTSEGEWELRVSLNSGSGYHYDSYSGRYRSSSVLVEGSVILPHEMTNKETDNG